MYRKETWLHGESEVQCLAEIKQNRQTQIGVFNVLNNEMNPFRRISMRSSFSLQSRPQQNIVSENNVCTGNCRLSLLWYMSLGVFSPFH